jgi:diadenosine tetraphosphatase ApaH/serine/threonine PP2A family protein phosphatase
MLAIISDLHSNTDALQAVLADIATRRVDQIICLGDVLGYGPEPTECLDLVASSANVTLMGNHDFAVLYEPRQFNAAAETASFWTRKQLEAEPDVEKRNARWAFLGSLPVKHTLDGGEYGMGPLAFYHGSPRRPINEYIFPEDAYNSPNKIRSIFDRFEHLCFVGHTHVPGVFVDPPDFFSPAELDDVYEVKPHQKALINVGSVGQPRDRDSRACYVLLKRGAVRFVRVRYDVKAVIEKINAQPDLDDYLGVRLAEGR